MDTPDLFSPHRLARSCDPDTSHEAAERIAPKLGKIQAQVLDAFKSRFYPNGMTDKDLEYFFESSTSTYRSRRAELVEMGLLKDSGRRKFQEGSNRIVWELAGE